MNGDTEVRNSGDSAAPSLPEKRLFMVGVRKRVRLAPYGFVVEQPMSDAGVPVLAKYSKGGTT